MSNQRVVVLTDEDLHLLQRVQVIDGANDRQAFIELRTRLAAALEHPEGITDDQVALALAKGHEFAPEEDGFQAMRACLEAALCAGDGEL